MTGPVRPLAMEHIRAVLVEIHREYPAASIWYGQATGRWWAIVPGWQQLLEARDLAGLRRLLDDIAVSRQAGPFAAPDTFRPDGSWRNTAPAPPAPSTLVWDERTPRRHAAPRGGWALGWLLGRQTAGLETAR